MMLSISLLYKLQIFIIAIVVTSGQQQQQQQQQNLRFQGLVSDPGTTGQDLTPPLQLQLHRQEDDEDPVTRRNLLTSNTFSSQQQQQQLQNLRFHQSRLLSLEDPTRRDDPGTSQDFTPPTLQQLQKVHRKEDDDDDQPLISIRNLQTSTHQSRLSDPGTGRQDLTPLRQVHRQEDDHDPATRRRNLQISTFSSRLQIEFESTANADIPTGDIRANDGSTSFSEIQTIIQPVLDILVDSYNNINTEDPFSRRVTNVELVSGVVTEVASGLIGGNRRERKLQDFLNFRFILELTGECNGCATNSALTNQVTPGGGNGGGRTRKLPKVEEEQIMMMEQQQQEDHHRTLLPGPRRFSNNRGEKDEQQHQNQNSAVQHHQQQKTQVTTTGPKGGRGSRDGDGEQQQKQSRRYLKQDKETTGSSVDTLPPTSSPTPPPSPSPTKAPSPAPSPSPTKAPSPAPTPRPSPSPTNRPTMRPTSSPTSKPTSEPTSPPTETPHPDSFLPTEEELRMAYSTSVMSLNNELISSVSGLQEIPFTCPSSNTPSTEGIPSLNNQILTNCSPGLVGFLVLNINQEGSWCLTTPDDDIGDNLRLQTCDFDTIPTSNEHSWTILSQGNGIMKFQSSIYTDRCMKVGNTGDDSIHNGIRLRIGTCDDFNTEFIFDYETQYLKVADDTSFCITNAGENANENDTLNARTCPTTTTTDDDNYQWLFLFA